MTADHGEGPMRNILIYGAVALIGVLWFMRRNANRGRKR